MYPNSATYTRDVFDPLQITKGSMNKRMLSFSLTNGKLCHNLCTENITQIRLSGFSYNLNFPLRCVYCSCIRVKLLYKPQRRRLVKRNASLVTSILEGWEMADLHSLLAVGLYFFSCNNVYHVIILISSVSRRCGTQIC